MNEYKYLVALSVRLYTRALHTTLLALVSLTVCVVALTVVWGIVTESERFVRAEQRTMAGGDVRVLAQDPIDEDIFMQADVRPDAVTDVIEFSGLLGYGTSSGATVEFRVVDETYPLYGTVDLAERVYQPLQADEIIIDTPLAERWGIASGAIVRIGAIEYRVFDRAIRYPDSWIQAFQFFPRVTLSYEGFLRSGLASSTLRASYERLYRVTDLSSLPREELETYAENAGYRLRLSDSESPRAFTSLNLIQTFLGIVVLCTLLLGLVNMYVATLYVCERHAHTVSILTALGLTPTRALVPVVLVLLYSLVCALVIGGIGGTLLLAFVERAVATYYGLNLSFAVTVQHFGFVVAIITGLVIPVIGLCVSEHRWKENVTPSKIRVWYRVIFGVCAAVPLGVCAYLAMDDTRVGVKIMLGIFLGYAIIAFLYARVVSHIYRKRQSLSFFWRSIIAWKYSDGIFGIVAFTSLFSALSIFFFLSLTFTSASRYLHDDLRVTAPRVYVLDIQESQVEGVQSAFPDLALVPTMRARLVSINAIPAETYVTSRVGSDAAREIRREFIVTSTTSVPIRDQEREARAPFGTPGFVSIDDAFRERLGLRLGDRLSFLIQGFKHDVVIGHIRTSDTTSGLPFFYFIFAPDDLAAYSPTYFGYAFYEANQITEVQSYGLEYAPNVSIIDTEAAQQYAASLLTFAESVMIVSTLPLLALAVILITALIIEQYQIRQRDAVRLLIMGAAPRMVWVRRIVEMLFTTIVAIVCAYIFACGGAWYVVTHILEIKTVSITSPVLMYGVGALLTLAVGIQYIQGRYTRDIYRVLHHEDNY